MKGEVKKDRKNRNREKEGDKDEKRKVAEKNREDRKI